MAGVPLAPFDPGTTDYRRVTADPVRARVTTTARDPYAAVTGVVEVVGGALPGGRGLRLRLRHEPYDPGRCPRPRAGRAAQGCDVSDSRTALVVCP